MVSSSPNVIPQPMQKLSLTLTCVPQTPHINIATILHLLTDTTRF